MSLENPKIKSTNIELTEAQLDYLLEKIAQIARIVPKDETKIVCDVELAKTTKHHKTGKIFRAEINLKIGKSFLRAEAVCESIEEAIDEVKDELKAEVRKLNDRRDATKKKGGRKIKKLMRGE